MVWFGSPPLIQNPCLHRYGANPIAHCVSGIHPRKFAAANTSTKAGRTQWGSLGGLGSRLRLNLSLHGPGFFATGTAARSLSCGIAPRGGVDMADRRDRRSDDQIESNTIIARAAPGFWSLSRIVDWIATVNKFSFGGWRARNPGGRSPGQRWGERYGIWILGAGEKDAAGITPDSAFAGVAGGRCFGGHLQPDASELRAPHGHGQCRLGARLCRDQGKGNSRSTPPLRTTRLGRMR